MVPHRREAVWSPHKRPGRQPDSLPRGLTLIELAIVIVLLALVGSLVVPRSASTAPQSLQMAGEILLADLAFARSLAITRGEPYRLGFLLNGDSYWIEPASGSTSQNLVGLSPFAGEGSGPSRLVFRLGQVPGVRARLWFADCHPAQDGLPQEVVFTSLGSLGGLQDVEIVLAAEEFGQSWLMSVRVQATTGRGSLGSLLVRRR